MRKKLRQSAGFTFAEILVALALMSLLAVAMGAAMPVASRLYQQTTAVAQANTLLGTIALCVSDELHYAENIRQTEGGVVFQSRRFGTDVTLEAPDGRVTVGGQEILSDKTYTGELLASVDVAYDGNYFGVEISIENEKGRLTHASFQIRPLNQ